MRTSSSFSSLSVAQSAGFSGSGSGWRLFRPCGVAFVGVGDAQQRRLVEASAGQLQADRQAVRCVKPHGTLIAGRPARFALTVKTSARYICSGSDDALADA